MRPHTFFRMIRVLEVRRHRYRRRTDLVELFLMSSEEVVNLVLSIHRQKALDRIVVDIDAEERAGCYTDRVDRPNSPWFSPPSVLDGSRGAVLVDVVLRYCCGLIHLKAPSQSGPAPVPAACGEIHHHSEALLFR